jgi:hypothetical protein
MGRREECCERSLPHVASLAQPSQTGTIISDGQKTQVPRAKTPQKSRFSQCKSSYVTAARFPANSSSVEAGCKSTRNQGDATVSYSGQRRLPQVQPLSSFSLSMTHHIPDITNYAGPCVPLPTGYLSYHHKTRSEAAWKPSYYQNFMTWASSTRLQS